VVLEVSKCHIICKYYVTFSDNHNQATKLSFHSSSHYSF